MKLILQDRHFILETLGRFACSLIVDLLLLAVENLDRVEHFLLGVCIRREDLHEVRKLLLLDLTRRLDLVFLAIAGELPDTGVRVSVLPLGVIERLLVRPKLLPRGTTLQVGNLAADVRDTSRGKLAPRHGRETLLPCVDRLDVLVKLDFVLSQSLVEARQTTEVELGLDERLEVLELLDRPLNGGVKRLLFRVAVVGRLHRPDERILAGARLHRVANRLHVLPD